MLFSNKFQYNLNKFNFINFTKFQFNLPRNINLIQNKSFTDKTTHYTIPSSDPHRPKKGVKKHKEHLQGKIKEEKEIPVHQGEDNIILKIPVTRQDPYVKDIPKVDRHKEDKNTKHRVGAITNIKGNIEEGSAEDEVEIPETRMNEDLTSITPTTKVKVVGIPTETEEKKVSKNPHRPHHKNKHK